MQQPGKLRGSSPVHRRKHIAASDTGPSKAFSKIAAGSGNLLPTSSDKIENVHSEKGRRARAQILFTRWHRIGSGRRCRRKARETNIQRRVLQKSQILMFRI